MELELFNQPFMFSTFPRRSNNILFDDSRNFAVAAKQIKSIRVATMRIDTYHVLVRVVLVVEDGNDLAELRQDVIVSCHVRGQDASDDALTYFPVEREIARLLK